MIKSLGYFKNIRCAFSIHIKPQLTFFPLEYTKYGGIAAILNLAMSRGRTMTNQTFFAGESQKQLNDIAHELTIIRRQLFSGHLVGSRPMKRKKHLHRIIIIRDNTY